MSKTAILGILQGVLSEELAVAVYDHRKTTIKKPLTEYAAKLLAKKFAMCADPDAAASIMIERCWQGFDPSWIRTQPRGAIAAAMEMLNGPESFAGNQLALECIPPRARH